VAVTREAGTRFCTLISASCTTGWTDWIHGELWLCSDGLLRRSLGLAATLRHGVRPTADALARPSRTFSDTDIRQIASANRRNRWIPWERVAAAELSHALGADSLRVVLDDGQQFRFLWLRVDIPFDDFVERLSPMLNERLTVR
jgi:hypothetical protein